MKTRDLNCVKCIKNEDKLMLVKEEEVKERRKCYFDKLFNGRHTTNWSGLSKGHIDEDENGISRGIR
jgi:uncharacterized protein (DUF608 family)